MATWLEFIEKQNLTFQQKRCAKRHKGKNMLTKDKSDVSYRYLGSSALQNVLIITSSNLSDQVIMGLISSIWKTSVDMVQNSQSQVGLSEKYEKWFGEKTFFNKTTSLRRADMVRNHFKTIKSVATTHDWIVKIESSNVMGSSIASFSKPTTLSINENRLNQAGEFTGGVLIHEWGHRIGLHDICTHENCHSAAVELNNLSAKMDQGCSNNNIHPHMHFIGTTKALELAQNHTNLTVWNTDSYRWYSCSLKKDKTINTFNGTAEQKRTLADNL